MKEKYGKLIFWLVFGACLAFTVAHLIYAVYAYQHCSIIYFVGKELW